MTKFLEQRKDKRSPERDIVVFYHADCTDGFTSAWVAWKKFGDTAEYIASFHDDEPVFLEGKEIYTIDITFPEVVTMRLMKDNKRVTAIDHHISTKETTLITHKPSFSLDHSGSTLAWKYFFPDDQIPQFLLNVEDRDLWRKKIPSSPVLYAYLDLFDFNFEIWDKLIKDFEVLDKRNKILETGQLLLKYEEKRMDRHINKNAMLVVFEGHKTYAINESGYASQIGERLSEVLPPISIIWRQNKNGLIIVSLRGSGDVDVSELAKKYGGGGHKNSAAFRLNSLTEIPWVPFK